jgi:hypothetical protein
VAVEPGQDGLARVTERGELLVGEHIDEAPAYVRHVAGRCGLDGGTTFRRQDHVRAAPVGVALLPAKQPSLGHPRELVRQAALLPRDLASDVPHSEPTSRRFGQADQDGVVGTGEAGVAGEVVVELAAKRGGQVLERPPRTLLVLRQPAG